MKLALVCDGEPGLGSCQRLAVELRLLGADVTLISPEVSNEHWLPLQPLVAASSDLLNGLDAVGVFLEGAQLTQFRQVHLESARLRGKRPCPLFTGPIRPLYGDTLMADLLPRLGYDLICLQGEAQMQELAWLVRGSQSASQASEAIGLWCLPTEPLGHSNSQAPLLLVLDQQDIPPSPFANGVLFQRLRTIAMDCPSWQIRIQPDAPLKTEGAQEPTTSLAWHFQQDLSPPSNLQLGQVDDLAIALVQSSACLGIASPWLLTAMVWGKPTVVLGDYGIRTDFNGPLFFGSGAMYQLAYCVPLDRLAKLKRPNHQWLAERGWAIANGPQRLLRRLEQLVERQP